MLSMKSEFDIRPVLALSAGLREEAIRQAWRRALRKTGEWVKTHVARQLSGELKIPAKVLKQRLYFFLRSLMEGKVWLGINPLEAARLGRVRQTRTGVTAGRHRFPGAWVMKYRDPNGVYRRTGSERGHYAKVMFEWDDAAERVFRQVAAQAEARLLVVLEQEIRWELRKVTG
ncbi:Uncharacterized protein ChrSV_1543 [Chromobacterium vaccinii]|nr:Uncharacterized protein ChrSW_1543 [Chromobacterium vaccinii]QND89001.1 Uncharacterized protein ChrSV_1543 [Chromobacterium vaccinii]